jgi:hypothetical protein
MYTCARAHTRTHTYMHTSTFILGVHAALSLLIALVVKLKLARAEAEAEAVASGGRKAGGALRGRVGLTGRVLASAEVSFPKVQISLSRALSFPSPLLFKYAYL